jgi:hypothetical protein
MIPESAGAILAITPVAPIAASQRSRSCQIRSDRRRTRT